MYVYICIYTHTYIYIYIHTYSLLARLPFICGYAAGLSMSPDTTVYVAEASAAAASTTSHRNSLAGLTRH